MSGTRLLGPDRVDMPGAGNSGGERPFILGPARVAPGGPSVTARPPRSAAVADRQALGAGAGRFRRDVAFGGFESDAALRATVFALVAVAAARCFVTSPTHPTDPGLANRSGAAAAARRVRHLRSARLRRRRRVRHHPGRARPRGRRRGSDHAPAARRCRDDRPPAAHRRPRRARVRPRDPSRARRDRWAQRVRGGRLAEPRPACGPRSRGPGGDSRPGFARR